MSVSCIYMISSLSKPHRFYIGSTSDYERRMATHRHRLRKNTHHSKIMQAHYNKYGFDDLQFEVIELVKNIDHLLVAEQSFLDLFKPKWNCSPTAKNTTGIKFPPRSIEHRRKISESNKGRIVSEATRQLIRKRVYKYSLNGELIEICNSLTEARTREGCNVMIHCDKTPTYKGFVWVSDLKKVPDFKMLNERLKKAERKLDKAVIQFNKEGEILSEYDSAREAWRQTGVHPSKICMVANGKRETAGGFIWKLK